MLLDQAGKQPGFIKLHLQWLSDSYHTYLQDTSVIQHQHVAALYEDSNKFTNLLGTNYNIFQLQSPPMKRWGNMMTLII